MNRTSLERILLVNVNSLFRDGEAEGEGENECQRMMDRSINPQDIMFVLGESQVCPSATAPCRNDLEDEEGDERLRLDLERYRSQGGGIKPYQMMTDNGSGIPACCELKVGSSSLD